MSHDTNAAVPPALIDAVVAYFHPRRVILFGSRARAAGLDSDYDLLVVLDEDAPPDKVRLEAGFESRRAYRQPADIVPCRESTYQRRARIPGTLCHAAATEGVVVYERN